MPGRRAGRCHPAGRPAARCGRRAGRRGAADPGPLGPGLGGRHAGRRRPSADRRPRRPRRQRGRARTAAGRAAHRAAGRPAADPGRGPRPEHGHRPGRDPGRAARAPQRPGRPRRRAGRRTGGRDRGPRAPAVGHRVRLGAQRRPAGAGGLGGVPGRVAAGPRPAAAHRPRHGRAPPRGRAAPARRARLRPGGDGRAGARPRPQPTTRLRWTAPRAPRRSASSAPSRACSTPGGWTRPRCCAPAGSASASCAGRPPCWTPTSRSPPSWSRPPTPPGCSARSSDADPVWLPTPAYDLWRADETTGRWVALASAWRDTTRVPALVGSRDAKDKALAALGPDLDRALAPEVRRGLLDVLAAAAPGTPVGAADVDAVLAWRRPRRPARLRAELVAGFLREAEQLGATGRGALSGPGRALLADDPAAARAALEPLLPQPLDHVLLQADLTAVAPGPLVSDLAQALALMADVERTGGATVYRFTPSPRCAGPWTPGAPPPTCTPSWRPTRAPRCRSRWPTSSTTSPGGTGGSGSVWRRRTCAATTTPCSPSCSPSARPASCGCAGWRRPCWWRRRRWRPSSRCCGRWASPRPPRARTAPSLTRRPDARRTATRAPAAPAGRRAPGCPASALVTAAVRALRAGERATSASRGPVVGGVAARGQPAAQRGRGHPGAAAGRPRGGPPGLDRLRRHPRRGHRAGGRPGAARRRVPHGLRPPLGRGAHLRRPPDHRGGRARGRAGLSDAGPERRWS